MCLFWLCGSCSRNRSGVSAAVGVIGVDVARIELTIELGGRDGTIATFEAAEEILEDASAYPRTESEITDFDQWTTVKRPLVPSLAFDVEMGETPDPAMYDVVRVPSGSDDGGLEIVERGGAIPLSELTERESENDRDPDRDRRDQTSGPLPEF